jgi:hypothetical protein
VLQGIWADPAHARERDRNAAEGTGKNVSEPHDQREPEIVSEYQRKINATIKQIEDDSGFSRVREAWEQRQGSTAEERLQDWVKRK